MTAVLLTSTTEGMQPFFFLLSGFLTAGMR